MPHRIDIDSIREDDRIGRAIQRVTFASLKWRSGLALRDGRRVQYVSYTLSGTIDQVGKKSEGVFCEAQRRYGVQHFAARGYKIFDAHLGIHGVKGWPDFAAARSRRVIFVECMSDWWVDETLQKKSEWVAAQKLWFIAEPGGKKELRRHGYVCEVLPCPDSDEFRDLDTTFWLCRPKGEKPL